MGKDSTTSDGRSPPNSVDGVPVLSGIGIVIPHVGDRPSAAAGALRAALSAAGARVTMLSLAHEERAEPVIVEQAVHQWDAYSWVLVASVAAMDQLADMTSHTGRRQGHHRLVCLGPGTAARADERGWHAAIATDSTAIGMMLDALSMRDDVEGARMLVLCAVESCVALGDGLSALGVSAELVPVTRTAAEVGITERLRGMAEAGAADLLVLTSTAAVDALSDAIPAELTRQFPTAGIGGLTARAARMAGFPVCVEQEYLSPPALVGAIAAVRDTLGSTLRAARADH